jgi:hypothetical protein
MMGCYILVTALEYTKYQATSIFYPLINNWLLYTGCLNSMAVVIYLYMVMVEERHDLFLQLWKLVENLALFDSKI